MTFSLVARCERTGQLGVGALTAMVGVGKLVSYAEPRVGAIASQATMNPYLGIDGLAMLRHGRSVQDTLDELIGNDPGRQVRQCGMVDSHGRTAAWTGAQTPTWSGHLEASDVVALGNRLVGQQTLERTLEAFTTNASEILAERLLRALEAGAATGSDRSGINSGAIYVVDTEQYPLWDVRVDHAEQPVARLRELAHEFAERLVPEIQQLPTRADPMGQAARKRLGPHG